MKGWIIQVKPSGRNRIIEKQHGKGKAVEQEVDF